MAGVQKVAVVTGAGTGIGKAVALALMREGYAAVLAGPTVVNMQAGERRRAGESVIHVEDDRPCSDTSVGVANGVHRNHRRPARIQSLDGRNLIRR